MVDAKKIVKKLKDIAIVKNLPVFLQKICEWRNISPADAWYRVCQDGGGGSFKSVVSVMDKGIDPSNTPSYKKTILESKQPVSGIDFFFRFSPRLSKNDYS